MEKSEDIPEVQLPLLRNRFSLRRLWRYDLDEVDDEELEDLGFSCLIGHFEFCVFFIVSEKKQSVLGPAYDDI
jgi:hypothetical protein